MPILQKPNPMGVTLARAKTRPGLADADDALLTTLIREATSRVEGALRRNIRQGRYRETIEQDWADETILLPGGGPFAAPIATANTAPVTVEAFDSNIGQIQIVPGGFTRFMVGALEPSAALTAYQVTFRRGWLLDEGAYDDTGLVESFVLLSEALTAETEIVIDAADLVADSKLPDGATLSLGNETLFVSTSTRDGGELTVELLYPLANDYPAGSAVEQVDERVPEEIQAVILDLVGDAYASATGAGVSAPAGVSEIEGDGYRLKFREAGDVEAQIRSRLARWVVLR